MSTTNHSNHRPEGVPEGTPFVSTDNYEVLVRLLFAPQGTLLVESSDEIRARYAEMKDDAAVRYAAEDAVELAAQVTRLDAAEAQEVKLFAQLEKQRGEEVKTFKFSMRVPTIADHESAEAEASKALPRQELLYRRILADRTLVKTDYPGFHDFHHLRTDVALHVIRNVATRVTMKSTVRDFLLTGEGTSPQE